jgi:transcription elongation factor Elf1
MATSLCDTATELVTKVKNKGKLGNENQNCCLEMEVNIQSLLNEVKSLNEIINILSEEWRQYEATEEVRNDRIQYAAKVKGDRIQYAAKVKGNRALNCLSINHLLSFCKS